MFKVVFMVDDHEADYEWFVTFKEALTFVATLKEENILEIKRYDN
jgi:hypothetical protein